MKKGFTLVELLAVIALLGVLAVIVAPAVNGSLQKSQNNLVEVQEKQIIKAAKDYYAEHLSELPTGDITDTKTLSYLQTEGYLSISLVDPKTKKNYDVNESTVTVSNSGDDEHNNYEYIVNLVVQSD